MASYLSVSMVGRKIMNNVLAPDLVVAAMGSKAINNFTDID